ncbi:ribbon-helix-helix domain-containing protein [Priestia flexa]|jgi:metal-responsive CopG/Arc/MetJ family transcriptional regulator|uniref:ribbon-helix-helix domain-containing protein n=1 Tax=Priestia flexa TaxID=86664 RepID=UPI001F4CA649|nr:ribbon-helix-helix domain-containing protein [Priestia flexa]
MSGHKKTPNAKPIINITIDEELLKQIEDFQFDNRFKNRSQAITHLIRKAINEESDSQESE